MTELFPEAMRLRAFTTYLTRDGRHVHVVDKPLVRAKGLPVMFWTMEGDHYYDDGRKVPGLYDGNADLESERLVAIAYPDRYDWSAARRYVAERRALLRGEQTQ